MREAIGGTWLFQIVIFFVLLFTGYMCLSINHSKAFNVKNTIIKTIEREEGINLDNPDRDDAIKKIVEYLEKASYRTTGKCPKGYEGFNRSGKKDSRNSAFCIRKQSIYEGSPDNVGNNTYALDWIDDVKEFPDQSYYRVVVFYQLDLPIFNEAFNFKVTGDTRIISK